MDFKDQFRSVLAYFNKELNRNGFCFIENSETIQNIDSSMYEFLIDRNIQAQYGLAIHDKENMIIGYVCLDFEDHSKASLESIKKVFNEKQEVIETLLSL
jgi:hypothetical protein